MSELKSGVLSIVILLVLAAGGVWLFKSCTGPGAGTSASPSVTGRWTLHRKDTLDALMGQLAAGSVGTDGEVAMAMFGGLVADNIKASLQASDVDLRLRRDGTFSIEFLGPAGSIVTDGTWRRDEQDSRRLLMSPKGGSAFELRHHRSRLRMVVNPGRRNESVEAVLHQPTILDNVVNWIKNR
ncbi:MAG: hypothetical protein H6811_09620 [Phycisphaeraceae bacterium]|nr:hypothetical protein [Phycisphaeraceae bacterium]